MSECEICGEQDHAEGDHELVAMGDWSVRGLHLADNMVDFALTEAEALNIDVSDIRAERAEQDSDHEDWLQVESERLDDIESRLGDAGFIATSNGDAGTWTIHHPVPKGE